MQITTVKSGGRILWKTTDPVTSGQESGECLQPLQTEFSILTCPVSVSVSTAPAEAGQRVQPGVVRLLLHAVRLLHQGPAQPGAARPLGAPPAERGPEEAPAAPAGPGRGRGRAEPRRALPRQGVPLQPRSVPHARLRLCAHAASTLVSRSYFGGGWEGVFQLTRHISFTHQLFLF